MRRHSAILVVSLLCVGLGACSKFTFVRQDAGRKSYRQVAPEYSFRKDPKRGAALAAADHSALASQSLSAGRLDEAEKQARAALKVDPRSADAHTVLALVASRRGQVARAGEHYGKAATLAPDQGAVLNNYGAWLCGNGRAIESLAWFDRALTDPRYPSKAAVRANSGTCAMQAGESARAERDLRAALEELPDNPVALASMAQLEFNNGRYMQARAFAERRLAAAAPDIGILGLAATIERKLGDVDAAARYSRQLTELQRAAPTQTGVAEPK